MCESPHPVFDACGVDLAAWGWDATLAAHLSALDDGLVPARVVVDHGRAYQLVTAQGPRQATLAGDLRRQAMRDTLPTPGDWVAIVQAASGGQAIITAVLPRRTCFQRRAAGGDRQGQIVAANVDTVFIVDSLDRPLNPRRLERYLALAWDSGAAPIVVLSKADCCPDVSVVAEAVEQVALGVPVLACSAVDGSGLAALAPYLQPGRTVALLGPSGVGKSTLVNALYGAAVQRVGAVRATDGKGRHTTTRRELVPLPSGALLLDTPGMRELGLWGGGDGVDRVFHDVAELSRGCRFADCQHAGEPGCAVAVAVAAGTLSGERLASHRKLRRELAHAAARHDARLGAEARRRERAVHRAHYASLRREPKHQ